jgi:hypothetical protein
MLPLNSDANILPYMIYALVNRCKQNLAIPYASASSFLLRIRRAEILEITVFTLDITS